MMGNPKKGLLKEIITACHKLDYKEGFHTDQVERIVLASGFYDGRDAATPRRTINSYLSQSPEVFGHIGHGYYRLKKSYWPIGKQSK